MLVELNYDRQLLKWCGDNSLKGQGKWTGSSDMVFQERLSGGFFDYCVTWVRFKYWQYYYTTVF
jgi:hypothetical protein